MPFDQVFHPQEEDWDRLIELPISPVYVDETIRPTLEFHMSLRDMRHNSTFYPFRATFFVQCDCA